MIQEVVLQHVVDATLHTRHILRMPGSSLRTKKNFLEHLGFVVKVNVDVITSGDISTAILTKAGCENISSIITGSRGRGRVKGLP